MEAQRLKKVHPKDDVTIARIQARIALIEWIQSPNFFKFHVKHFREIGPDTLLESIITNERSEQPAARRSARPIRDR